MIITVTGKKGAGKTTLLKSIIEEFKKMGLNPGGIISERMTEENRTGYKLFLPATGERFILATAGYVEEDKKHFFFRAYSFYSDALTAGNLAIETGLDSDCLFLDEIGVMETDGGGWAAHLGRINRCKAAILSLRKDTAAEVCRRWDINPSLAVDLDETDTEKAFSAILALFHEKP
jgi:nucleoside-triphosphatase THEP1